MEKQQERVMAYHLAKVIEEVEWDQVAGGVTDLMIKPSIMITAGHWHSPDCVYDSSH